MLGYIAYIFISSFGFLQLGAMIRGRTLDLGRWPMVSLIVGLALLEVALMTGPAPLYLRVGNPVSLTGSVLSLLWTLPPYEPADTPADTPVDIDERIDLTAKGYRATDKTSTRMNTGSYR